MYIFFCFFFFGARVSWLFSSHGVHVYFVKMCRARTFQKHYKMFSVHINCGGKKQSTKKRASKTWWQPRVHYNEQLCCRESKEKQLLVILLNWWWWCCCSLSPTISTQFSNFLFCIYSTQIFHYFLTSYYSSTTQMFGGVVVFIKISHKIIKWRTKLQLKNLFAPQQWKYISCDIRRNSFRHQMKCEV